MAIGSGRSDRYLGMWGYDTAMGAKREGQDLLSDYLGRGLGAIGQGRTDALGALGSGYDRARTDLNTQFTGAIDRMNPWVTAGTNALGAYQGSLGLGGDAARDAAVSAYRTSPGYERRVEEATDAVARKASALGALGSGNTMQAISDRANALADEDYGRWQSQLAGLSDRGQQAAGVQAGLQGQLGTSLAALGQGQGRDTAGLYSDAAAREAGLYGQFGNLGLSNLWQGTQLGTNAVMTAGQRAKDSVNSGWSLGLNALGSGIGLLGLGMGGGNTLGGNALKGLGFGR